MPILWSISGSPWRRGLSRVNRLNGKKNGSNLAAFSAWSLDTGRTPYDQWIASTVGTDSTKRRGTVGAVGAVGFFFWWEKTLPSWYPSTGVVPDLGFDCHFWKCSEQAAVSWNKWNDGTFNMAQCYEITHTEGGTKMYRIPMDTKWHLLLVRKSGKNDICMKL